MRKQDAAATGGMGRQDSESMTGWVTCEESPEQRTNVHVLRVPLNGVRPVLTARASHYW